MGIVLRLLGGAVVGAVSTTVLWFIINRIWTVNGVGLLERQVWPVSSVYVCAAIGSLVGMFKGLWNHVRIQSQLRELRAYCEQHGFAFEESVEKKQLGSAAELSLFSNWHRGANRISGKIGEIPFQMFDYTKYIKGDGDSNSSYPKQSVMLLPAPFPDSPSFELQTRGAGHRMMKLMGIEGMVFQADDSMPPAEAAIVQQFNRNYFLSSGRHGWLPRKTKDENSAELDDEVRDADIRGLFTLGALAYFANNPGLTVACKHDYLAVWREQKVIDGDRRDEFLDETLAVRAALLASQEIGSAARVMAGAMHGDVSQFPLKSLGAFLGFGAGSLAGFLLFGFLMFTMPQQFKGLGFLMFFPMTIGIGVLGSLVGNLAMSYVVVRFRRWKSRDVATKPES